MEQSYHNKTGRRNSHHSDRLQKRFRQVPIKSLATIMVLAQMQMSDKTGGLVSAAQVEEKQQVGEQLEVQEQLDQSQAQQQQLQQQLKEAQALEQKLRLRLRARSKDAEADGLEDNDYAINSIEEFVDTEQLEEAGQNGNSPADEVSTKHTTVPVSLSKSQSKKQNAGIKPKPLSLKKLSAAQLGHAKGKQANSGHQQQRSARSSGKKSGTAAPRASPKHADLHKKPVSPAKKAAAPQKPKTQSLSQHKASAAGKKTQKNTHQQQSSRQSGVKSSQGTHKAAVGHKQMHSEAHAPQHHRQVKPHQQFQEMVLSEGEDSQSLANAMVMSQQTTEPQPSIQLVGGAQPETKKSDQGDELKKKAIEATLAKLKAKQKAREEHKAHSEPTTHQEKKVSATKAPAPAPAAASSAPQNTKPQQNKETKKVPKEQSKPLKEQSKPEKETKPQAAPKPQPAANAADVEDTQAVSQLNAEALEYSVQTLGGTADQDSIEQPAALKEVEVIQPKAEPPKPAKKAQSAVDLKKDKKKEDAPHEAKKSEHKGAQGHAAPHVAPAKPVAHEQPKPVQTHAPPHEQPRPHPRQISKPMQQLKSKVNELTEPVITQLNQIEKVAPVKPKLEQKSKEKYSQAQRASEAAKQAREKADTLKKEKIAMQAKAADLGSQHKALDQAMKGNQDQKKHEGAKKQQQAPPQAKQMDLIAQAIKHQKQMSTPAPSKSVAPAAQDAAPLEGLDKPDKSKNAAEPQSLADANDILSALGQEPLQQALKNQEIKPEQNMIRIEDVSQAQEPPAEKPQAEKQETAPPNKADSIPIIKEKTEVKSVKTQANPIKEAATPAKTKLEKTEKPIGAAKSVLELKKTETSANPAQQLPSKKAGTPATPQKAGGEEETGPLAASTTSLTASLIADVDTKNEAQAMENQMTQNMALQDLSKMLEGDPNAAQEALNSVQEQSGTTPAAGAAAQPAAAQAVAGPTFNIPSLAAAAEAAHVPAPEKAATETNAQSDLIKKLTQQAVQNHKQQSQQVQPKAQAKPAVVAEQQPQKQAPAAAPKQVAPAKHVQGKHTLPTSPMKTPQEKSQDELIKSVIAKAHEEEKQKAQSQAETKPVQVQSVAPLPAPVPVASEPHDAVPTVAEKQTIPSGEKQVPKLSLSEAPSQADQDKQKSAAVQSVLNKLKKGSTKAVKEDKPAAKAQDRSKESMKKSEKAAKAASLIQKTEPKSEVPDKAVLNEGLLDAVTANMASTLAAPTKPTAKPQDGVATESLEELMQKFAGSDGQDDQALTDSIIREVEASDREQARAAAKKSTPEVAHAAGSHHEQQAEKTQQTALVKQAPKEKAPIAKVSALSKPAQLAPTEQKASKVKPTIPQKSPVQAMPQMKGDYGEDELKAVDGAFSGHQGAEGPLDAAKLEAEIKPAVKDITTKDIKSAVKAPKGAAVQAAHQQAQAPKKAAPMKTAAKPVPRQQGRNLLALTAKPAPKASPAPKAGSTPTRHESRPQPATKPSQRPQPKKVQAPAKPAKPVPTGQAPPTPAPESHLRQSSFLGHQNQLEQQLDEKIRKKLEEEEGGDIEDDEKRVTQEIKQVMAQDDAKKEEKKEEKKEDKKEEGKKDEKKDEKKEEPAPPPPPPKKPAPPLELDPLPEHYYDDDPYFVRRRPQPRKRPQKHYRPRYYDEDILDGLNEDALMHRLLQDLHIHDDHSSKRAIEYLEQHYQKDSLALKDLVGKAKELDNASEQIKKTQDAMSAERTKIHKLLEELIAKMDKDRSEREKKAAAKLRQLEQADAERRKTDQKEQVEQEKIARAIVEQENQKHEKADELAERYIDLKRKDERVQNTLRAVTSEAARVKRDLAIVKMHAQGAKEATKHWQEHETERLGRDKDSLLEKYLHGRSEHETQLRNLEHNLKMKGKKIQHSLKGLGQTSATGVNGIIDADAFDSKSHGGYGHYDHFDHYDRYDPLDDHPLYDQPYYLDPYPQPEHPRRRRHHDYYDEFDRVEDDINFDGGPSLLDKIKHLKRIQSGKGECREEPPRPRMHRGGLDGGYGHSGGYSKSTDSSKMHRKKSAKKAKQDKGYGGDNDFDFDLPDDHEGEYDWPPVKGLSNQIRHVGKLRKLPPFKDLNVHARSSRMFNQPATDLSEQVPGEQQMEFLAQKSEPTKAEKPEEKPNEYNTKMNKIDQLMKQVKNMTSSEEAEQPAQAASAKI